MNVLISGLTGSGKTTFSAAVARHLRTERISGSVIRQCLVTGSDHPDERSGREFWLFAEQARAVDIQRLEGGGADDVDEVLLQLYRACRRNVFDVWFLPWLVPRGALTIWLESPLEVRAKRIVEDSGHRWSFGETLAAVRAKDERSRAYGLKRYGIDIFVDRKPFDVVVDNGVAAVASLVERTLCTLASAAMGGNGPHLSGAEVTAAERFL